MSQLKKPKYLSAPPLDGGSGEDIAYNQVLPSSEHSGPGFIFCGGLKSDMEGGKATTLHEWADDTGRGFVRFDYYGHGQSSGKFVDGHVSRWRDDVVHVLDKLTTEPQILVGSSMGGWTSLLAAMMRPGRVAGLVLIAPAPDFTEKLMWASYSEAIRAQIMEEGIYYAPSDYGDPYEITRALIEDGRKNLIMDAAIPLNIPVRILQGGQDSPVPPSHSQKLVDLITSDDLTYTLVKDGDHSLSRPQDLIRLLITCEEISAAVSI